MQVVLSERNRIWISNCMQCDGKMYYVVYNYAIVDDDIQLEVGVASAIDDTECLCVHHSISDIETYLKERIITEYLKKNKTKEVM